MPRNGISVCSAAFAGPISAPTHIQTHGLHQYVHSYRQEYAASMHCGQAMWYKNQTASIKKYSVIVQKRLYTGWAKKTGLFSDLITL